MTSEGTDTLILAFSSKTGQSVARYTHRIFLFGFFNQREDIFIRDVKSCQIRHPEVRIKYPDTSEGSHRISSYICLHGICKTIL